MSDPPSRRGRPANPDRLVVIADAIVTLLAASGARGLTHRAVDRHAGLPSGTAGYHAPTHLDLMILGSRRIGELGMAELGWLTALIEGKAALTPAQLVDPLLATWRERLRPDRRHRARAEIAVALSSGGDPAIRAVYTAPTMFVAIWTKAMALLGARSPRAAAIEFTGMIRGRFYHHILSGASLDDERALKATLLATLSVLIALDLGDSEEAEASTNAPC